MRHYTLIALAFAASQYFVTVPALSADCTKFKPPNIAGTISGIAPPSLRDKLAGGNAQKVDLGGAPTSMTALRAPAGTTQIQDGFDGQQSVVGATANAIVTISLLTDRGEVSDACNGVQYAAGLIATNAHCFEKPYKSIVVDFGKLFADHDKEPDFHGELRCPASKVTWAAPNGVDVAVVRLDASPSQAFRDAVMPFDLNSGKTPREVYLTHYWLDEGGKVYDQNDKLVTIQRLLKYDQSPPSCRIYAATDLTTCGPYGVMHKCDTGAGSSGAPLYLRNGQSSSDWRSVALNTGGVPSYANCAVPAAEFARSLPK